ncbi:DUF4229 domain-containing protein [Streptomyces corynorhini]|nr:DUF4229 domain-containing protein [Streptomyces corynorhini]
MTAAKTNATIRYTAMRFGIFVLCFAFVALLVQFGILPKGLGNSNFVWVPLLAIIISAPLSFVLLRKQRDAMSEQLAPRVDQAKARLDARLESNRSQEDGALQ